MQALLYQLMDSWPLADACMQKALAVARELGKQQGKSYLVATTKQFQNFIQLKQDRTQLNSTLAYLNEERKSLSELMAAISGENL